MTITDVIDAWLATKQTTPWGRAWDVNSDTERRKAAQWLAIELHGLEEFYKEGE